MMNARSAPKRPDDDSEGPCNDRVVRDEAGSVRLR